MQYKKALLIFIITLIVSLTPAFAVKMENVANAAEKYNEDSKKKMGFIAKINFLARGYSLMANLQEAIKGSYNELNTEISTDEYENMWNQHVNSEKQRKILLKFRNSKNNNISKTSDENINKNQVNTTNSINSTSNNTQVSNKSSIIPHECNVDANNIIRLLNNQSIILSQNIQQEITKSLKHNIVQLIDENGNIRYAYVKSIEFNGNNSKVILITDKDKETTIDLEEFKKAYTGIVLNLNSTYDPVAVIGTITNLQKNMINKSIDKASQLKDRAKKWAFISLAVSLVGLILFVIGLFLALWFGNWLAGEAETASAEVTDALDPIDTPSRYNGEITNEMDYSNVEPDPPSGDGSYQDTPLEIQGTALNVAALITKLTVVAEGQAAAEALANSGSGNAVKLICQIIGIALILIGGVMACLGIIFGSMSVVRYFRAGKVIESLNKRNNDTILWLSKKQLIYPDKQEMQHFQINNTTNSVLSNKSLNSIP